MTAVSPELTLDFCRSGGARSSVLRKSDGKNLDSFRPQMRVCGAFGRRATKRHYQASVWIFFVGV